MKLKVCVMLFMKSKCVASGKIAHWSFNSLISLYTEGFSQCLGWEGKYAQNDIHCNLTYFSSTDDACISKNENILLAFFFLSGVK